MKQATPLQLRMAFVAVSLFCPTPALGKLAPSTLNDLIADSDLIVEAVAERVNMGSTKDNKFAGVAGVAQW